MLASMTGLSLQESQPRTQQSLEVFLDKLGNSATTKTCSWLGLKY